MKNNLIFTIKGIVFLGIFLTLFALLNMILKPKWITTWQSTKNIEGFYEEPDNSLDVVFLGSSQIISGISPMQLYHNYGFTSYNIATEQQNFISSYYWLKEVLRKQSPKVVVLDTMSLFQIFWEDDNLSEEYFRKAFDYMQPSSVKYEALKDICRIDSSQSMLSYYIPSIRYHDRWKSLEKMDFDYLKAPRYDTNKGLRIRTGYRELSFSGFTPNKLDKPSTPIPIMKEYLHKIIKLCDDNNIQLVLFKTPRGGSQWLADKYLAAKAIADENKLPYIDFNEKSTFNAARLNSKTDYLDTFHMNIDGAAKISKYMGSYISNRYDLPDHRDDIAYSQWNMDYNKYILEIGTCQFEKCTDIYEYLSLLNNDRYTAIMSVKYDAGSYFTPAMFKSFNELGLKTNLALIPKNSYIAVINNKDVYEHYDRESISYRFQLNNQAFCEILSRGYESNNLSSIKIDSVEYSVNAGGLNIVVYDNLNNEVVDKVCFQTCYEKVTCKR